MTDSPIIFYHYFDLTNVDQFCHVLEKRFHETGHDREIIFREWNCYNEEPGRDGDMFSYDCLALSALVAKGYIRELPDIIDVSDCFPWVLDTTRVNKKYYGIPLMTCCNTLICRREDDENPKNIFAIEDNVAAALRSLVFNYYLEAYCLYQTHEGGPMDALRRLRKLMGGQEDFDGSHLSNFVGLEKFIKGECRYLLAFTEILRHLPKDDYVIRQANLSDKDTNDLPLMMVDCVSMGVNVAEEKLLDCLDLLEIISEPSFIRELCVVDGKMEYMLPVHRSLYPELIEKDPHYEQLYAIAANPDNCATRGGADYFDTHHEFEDRLLKMLRELEDEERDAPHLHSRGSPYQQRLHQG